MGMANVRIDLYEDNNWYKNASCAKKGYLYCIHDYKHGICKIGVGNKDDENIAKSYIENYPFDVELYLLEVESKYHAHRYALWLLDDLRIKSSWYKIDPHQFIRMDNEIKEVTEAVINKYKESPEYEKAEKIRIFYEYKKQQESIPYTCDHCSEKLDKKDEVMSHIKQCYARGNKMPAYRERTTFGFDILNKVKISRNKSNK